MYVLIDDKKALIEEVKNLKEQLSTASNPELEKELEEAKIQWEYYQGLYESEKADKQHRIRKCFQWIKQKYPKAEREEFRDWVLDN